MSENSCCCCRESTACRKKVRFEKRRTHAKVSARSRREENRRGPCVLFKGAKLLNKQSANPYAGASQGPVAAAATVKGERESSSRRESIERLPPPPPCGCACKLRARARGSEKERAAARRKESVRARARESAKGGALKKKEKMRERGLRKK